MSLLTNIIGLEKSIKDAKTKIANLAKKRASDAEIDKLKNKIASDQEKLEKLVKDAQYAPTGVFPENKPMNNLFADESPMDDAAELPDGSGAFVDTIETPEMGDETAGMDEGIEEPAFDEGVEEEIPGDLDQNGIDDSVDNIKEEISNAVGDVIENKLDAGADIDELLASLRGDDVVDYESETDEEFEPGDEAEFGAEEEIDESGMLPEEDEYDEELMKEDVDNQEFDEDEFGDEELEDENSESEEHEDFESPEEEEHDNFDKEDGSLAGTNGSEMTDTPVHMASISCKSCKSSTFIKKSNKLVCQHCGKPLGISMIEGDFDVPLNKDFEGNVEKTFDDVEELAGDMFDPEMHEEHEMVEELPDGDIEVHEEHSGEFEDTDLEEYPESENEEHEEESEFGEEESENEHEESEENEFENEEHEEHEINHYSAKLVKKENKEDSYWNVYCNSQPMFRIIAKSAWQDLDAQPKSKEFPYKFASYWDVFASKLYHNSIVEHCNQFGIKQACSLANGRLFKSAQLSNYGGNPATGPMGENPMPNTGQAGGMNAGMEDVTNAPGTLNPDQEGMDQLGGTEDNKVLISDMIINWLAPEVANNTYTVDEILTELKATFSDEAAAAEFQGQLSAQADTYLDKAEKSPEEATGDIDLAGGLGGASPEMGAPGQSENSQMPASPPAQPMRMEASKELAEKDEIIRKQAETIDEQSEEIALRFKVASALQFVKNEMQTRGHQDVPLVATIESLLKEGKSKDDAIILAESAVTEKVKSIVKLSDEDFETYSELVYNTPKLNEEPTNEYAEAMEKQASMIPYMPAEQKVGLDAVLPEEGFRTGLSDAAEKHAAQRQKRQYY